jgi:hypothetical protein
MRFIAYVPAVVRGAKIDWEEGPIALTSEERAALLPHNPTMLRGGRLRRPFHVKAPRAGTRAQPVMREEIVHRKGALVFTAGDESLFLFEASDGDE